MQNWQTNRVPVKTRPLALGLRPTVHRSPEVLCLNRPFATMGHVIILVSPKMMCNHNIISRNEKNRSKLVILQSFSLLCYIFRKWDHFHITKFNIVSLYGRRARLALQQLFPIQILLIFLRFKLTRTCRTCD